MNNQMTSSACGAFRNGDVEILYEVGIESQIIKIWHIF